MDFFWSPLSRGKVLILATSYSPTPQLFKPYPKALPHKRPQPTPLPPRDCATIHYSPFHTIRTNR